MEDDKNARLDKMMKFKQEMQRLGLSPVKTEDYVSPLNDAVMKFKGEATSANVTPINQMVKGVTPNPMSEKTVIKGVTDHINTNEIQKLISGNDRVDKIAKILESRKLAKMAKSAGGIAGDMIKKVPMIGGIAAGLGTLLTTGDASAASQAALPLIGDADDLGPEKGSLESKLESGTITQDEMQQLLNRSK